MGWAVKDYQLLMEVVHKVVLRRPRVMILIKPSRKIKMRDPRRAMYSRLFSFRQ